MKKLIYYSFYLMCALVVVYFSYVYITEPYLDYDQAGQFWISRGLNHYSAPFSAEGNLWDVMLNNRDYNKDPGGFSFLLFLWEKGGTNYVYLRVLPFLFFVLFCLSVAKIIYKATSKMFFSVVAFSLPFVLPVFTNRVAELRAYSMELLGTSLIVYLIMCYKEKLTYRRLLLLSLSQCLFCTSRYGFIVVSFALSLRILYLLNRQYNTREFIRRSVVYSTPLFIVVVAVYLLSMRYQTGVSYYPYLYSTPLLYLISPLSLLFYVNILFLLYYRKKHMLPELCIDTVLVVTVFFVLSSLNLYPWSIRTISVLLLLFFNSYLFLSNAIPKWADFSAGCIMTACSLLLLTNFTYIHKNRSAAPFIELFDFLTKQTDGDIYVTWWHNPSLRYHFEFGFMKNMQNVEYPNRFVLEVGNKHNEEGVHKGHGKGDVNSRYSFLLLETEEMKEYPHVRGYKHIYKSMNH